MAEVELHEEREITFNHAIEWRKVKENSSILWMAIKIIVQFICKFRHANSQRSGKALFF